MVHPLRAGGKTPGKSLTGLDKEAAFELAAHNADVIEHEGRSTGVQRVVHGLCIAALCVVAAILGLQLVSIIGGIGVESALLFIMQPLILMVGSGEMLAMSAGGTLVVLAALVWMTRDQ